MNIKLFGLSVCLFAAIIGKGENLRDFLTQCVKMEPALSAAEKSAVPVNARGAYQASARYVSQDKIVVIQGIKQAPQQELRFYNMQKTMLRKRTENAALQEFEYQMIRNLLPAGIPQDIQNELCRRFAGVWKFHVAKGVKISQFDGKDGKFAVSAVLRREQITFPAGAPDAAQVRQAAVTRLPKSIDAQLTVGKTPDLREIVKLANLLAAMDNTHPYISLSRYIVAGFAAQKLAQNDADTVRKIFTSLPSDTQENLLLAAEMLNREKDMEFFLDKMLAADSVPKNQ